MTAQLSPAQEAMLQLILSTVSKDELKPANGRKELIQTFDCSATFYTKSGLCVRGLWFDGEKFDTVKVSKWVQTGMRRSEGYRADIETPAQFKALLAG